MELDDLLRGEGLDAEGVEDALAWARRRAAELVRGIDGDPELGPLLGLAVDGHAVPHARVPTPAPAEVRAEVVAVEPAPPAEVTQPVEVAPPVDDETQPVEVAPPDEPAPPVEVTPPAEVAAPDEPSASETRTEAEPETPPELPPEPKFTDLRGLQAALLAAARADGEPPVAEPEEPSLAVASADGARAAESADVQPADVQPVPHVVEASVEAEPPLAPPPEADLDPLAGIDFDDLPSLDGEDEDEDAERSMAEAAAPAVVEPPLGGGAPEGALDHRTTDVPTDSVDSPDSPDATMPAMRISDVTQTMRQDDPSLPAGDLTERAPNPLLQEEARVEAEARAQAQSAAMPTPTPAPIEVTARAFNPLQDGTAAPEAVGPTITEKAEVPTEAEPPAAASAGGEEVVELDEIEMLDDDDLLLMEEEQDGEDEGEVPEWKQALASVEHEGSGAPPSDGSDG